MRKKSRSSAKHRNSSSLSTPSSALGWLSALLIGGLLIAILIASGAELPFLGASTPYEDQWEGRISLAGVVLGYDSVSDMWAAGENPPYPVGTKGEVSQFRMAFDPDANKYITAEVSSGWWGSDTIKVYGDKFGYPNVLVEVGDFYETSQPGILSGFFKEQLPDHVKYEVVVQGEDKYNKTQKYEYFLSTWEFDVMVNYWTSTDETQFLSHQMLADHAQYCTEFDLDNYGDLEGPKQCRVSPIVKIELDPWTKVRGIENIYGAIMRTTVLSNAFYHQNLQTSLTAPTFDKDSYDTWSQKGFEAVLREIADNENSWHSGYLTTDASSRAARAPMYSSIAGQTLPESDMDESKAITDDSRSSAYVRLPAAVGMPGWWSKKTSIGKDEMRDVHIIPVTVIYKCQVEVLHTVEWEPQLTKFGDELDVPHDQQKYDTSEDEGFNLDLLNPFTWPWEWQLLFLIALGFVFLVLIITILTQLGRSPVRMAMVAPGTAPPAPPKTQAGKSRIKKRRSRR